MKKVLIIGPIGDFGGRELEVGFIANVLRLNYEVTICSTGNISNTSQVYHFNPKQRVVTLNQLLYNNDIVLKLAANFSCFKNFNNNATVSNFTNNRLAKRYLNYNKKKAVVLKKVVKQFDLIFICAQLSSSFVPEIINFSKEFNKPILFRTTGNIYNNQNLDCLKYVNIFIHHSHRNARKLSDKYNYKIIDQCAFNEISLLKIPTINKKVNNFMTVSRIEKDKNIEVVVKAFLKNTDVNDRLYVVGMGSDLSRLVNNTKDERVVFTGFIPNNELQKIFNICECFIVSYYELEAGPLTGIEAMAAGKVIISSKTGAMIERISDEYTFWHNNDIDNLYQKIKQVKALSIEKVKVVSEANRARYNLAYSKNIIKRNYIEIISNFIN